MKDFLKGVTVIVVFLSVLFLFVSALWVTMSLYGCERYEFVNGYLVVMETYVHPNSVLDDDAYIGTRIWVRYPWGIPACLENWEQDTGSVDNAPAILKKQRIEADDIFNKVSAKLSQRRFMGSF